MSRDPSSTRVPWKQCFYAISQIRFSRISIFQVLWPRITFQRHSFFLCVQGCITNHTKYVTKVANRTRCGCTVMFCPALLPHFYFPSAEAQVYVTPWPWQTQVPRAWFRTMKTNACNPFLELRRLLENCMLEYLMFSLIITGGITARLHPG